MGSKRTILFEVDGKHIEFIIYHSLRAITITLQNRLVLTPEIFNAINKELIKLDSRLSEYDIQICKI